MNNTTIKKFYQSTTNPSIKIPVTEFDRVIKENSKNPDYEFFCEIIQVVTNEL